MIKELFLCAALALPTTQVPSVTMADVKVIQLLLRFSKNNMYELPHKRIILLIGGLTELINPLRLAAENVWRLTMFDEHQNDVIGSFFNQPFKESGAVMVIFRMHAPANRWGSMRVLTESIFSIVHGGYFLFDPKKAPEFVKHLDRYGFEKLPIRWHNYLIYIRNGPPKKLTYIDGVHPIYVGDKGVLELRVSA